VRIITNLPVIDERDVEALAALAVSARERGGGRSLSEGDGA